MNAVRDEQGNVLRAGDHHYRAFVGPPARFDLLAASQFQLMTSLGLRDTHTLLDIGCGSCRAGRLFIPYLRPGGYFGLEPEQWLVEEGLAQELGGDIVRIKRPTFLHNTNFTVTEFGRQFDFLLAQSILSHTSETQLRRCLSQAREVMHPESIFAANFKLGPRTEINPEWTYPHSVTMTWPHFQKFVHDSGLSCVPLDWPHPTLTWAAIVLPGSESIVPELGRPGERLSFAKQSAKKYRPSGAGLAHRVRRIWNSFRRESTVRPPEGVQ